MATVHFDFDGIRVEGTQYTVWVHPLAEWRAAGDPALVIGVDGKSPLWKDEWARLTYGFVFTLEPGMRAFLTTELPRVDRVTRLAATLRAAVEPYLGRMLEPYAWSTLRPHEAAALVSVASNVVLRGRTPAEALAHAILLHDGRWAFSDEGDDPQYAELGAALRQPGTLAASATAIDGN